jgi:hypothetical protein
VVEREEEHERERRESMRVRAQEKREHTERWKKVPTNLLFGFCKCFFILVLDLRKMACSSSSVEIEFVAHCNFSCRVILIWICIRIQKKDREERRWIQKK